MAQSSTPSTSSKRKLTDREPSGLIFDGVVMSVKKLKLAPTLHNPPLKEKVDNALKNATEEFPNGYVYCHQCRKRRDAKVTISCTAVYMVGKKERSCKASYCKTCLLKKYGEEIARVSRSTYNCPKCRDVCMCHTCRKAKGLEPLRKKLSSTNPGDETDAKSKHSEPKAFKEPAKSTSKTKETASAATKAPVQPVVKPPKVLPVLNWERVPSSLNEDEANDRILIREFMFRFGDYLDPVIGKGHSEELEFFGGRANKQADNSGVTVWVGEMTIKSLVVGLLGLFAAHRDAEATKLIKNTLKEMRSAGANLNKLWSLLSALRDDVAKITTSESSSCLTFPNPSPPPPNAAPARSLRNVKTSDDALHVAQSSQMIPVLLALINLALHTSSIRDEIDQGLKDNKDVTKDAKEATRLENERWEEVKKTMESPPDAKQKNTAKDKERVAENKIKRATHKDNMTRIENALRIVSSSFSPRFITLGTDLDGRVYYALSPGVAEREAALEFLNVASSSRPMKMKKKARLLNEEERQEMREWSWFVAVWGEKSRETTSGDRSKRMDLDDEDEVESGPHWWGFWDIQEINKLAEWVSIKSGLSDDEQAGDTPSAASSVSSSKATNKAEPKVEQLKRLVHGLKDYATLLEWRVKEDKYTSFTTSKKA
ncbi:hypothetical protein CPB83DRAFT_856322 [Crepidotus variabilis]|uniref:Zinc-finger domain-containing protein n=1 Tax=Crepidotus variabilis TaxID=179855 RepID=A0A9P6EDY0_9AGAR|nr:hypothetical protein CPB83DRAFT_856322 [Crepidotus variabilis]